MDNLLQGEAVTYIKMDVEGAEKQALSGLEQHIKSDRPKMFIAAYHYDNDFFELPELLWQLCPKYKIYLRKHRYVPAWEMNFMAVYQGTQNVPVGQK